MHVEIESFVPEMQEEISSLFARYFTFLGEPFEPTGRHGDVTDVQHSYMDRGQFFCLKVDGITLSGAV